VGVVLAHAGTASQRLIGGSEDVCRTNLKVDTFADPVHQVV
jgi:hypothetical protein